MSRHKRKKKTKPSKESATQPSRKRLFLSFCRRDSALAHALYELLASFIPPLWIFKADEPSGIELSDEWRTRIRTELNTCDVLVALATPSAILERWLWIEAGAVWARDDSRVVVLTAPLIKPGDIIPLDARQFVALDHSDQKSVTRAMEKIAALLGRPALIWTTKRRRLLDQVLALARAPLESTIVSGTPPPPDSPTEHRHDLARLETILSGENRATIDEFFELAKQEKMRFDILVVADALKAATNAPGWILYDVELRDRLEAFAARLDEATAFPDYFYDSLDSDLLTLGYPGIKDPRLPKIRSSFRAAVAKAAEAYASLVLSLARYPELLSPATDKPATDVKFSDDVLVELLEGTRPQRTIAYGRIQYLQEKSIQLTPAIVNAMVERAGDRSLDYDERSTCIGVISRERQEEHARNALVAEVMKGDDLPSGFVNRVLGLCTGLDGAQILLKELATAKPSKEKRPRSASSGTLDRTGIIGAGLAQLFGIVKTEGASVTPTLMAAITKQATRFARVPTLSSLSQSLLSLG